LYVAELPFCSIPSQPLVIRLFYYDLTKISILFTLNKTCHVGFFRIYPKFLFKEYCQNSTKRENREWKEKQMLQKTCSAFVVYSHITEPFVVDLLVIKNKNMYDNIRNIAVEKGRITVWRGNGWTQLF